MLDVLFLIKTFGYLGLFAVIFAETGLFLGFFLPGDSLLFTAGILAAQGTLDIFTVCALVFAGAVIGNSLGYVIGHRFGRKLFHKEDSLLFHKDHLERAKNFYDQHGAKTIILARFMPIIRTFAPVVAGLGEMPFSKFFIHTFIGAILWAIGIPLAGYFLGKSIPNIDKYLLPIIGFIVFASLFPAFYHTAKSKDRRDRVFSILLSLFAKKQ